MESATDQSRSPVPDPIPTGRDSFNNGSGSGSRGDYNGFNGYNRPVSRGSRVRGVEDLYQRLQHDTASSYFWISVGEREEVAADRGMVGVRVVGGRGGGLVDVDGVWT